ncbi:MAG: 2-oxo acid dehydrogenase subunit E2 [Saprospiraceae bacterium]|nr:2-oxo acid dehydrogenase subunit E2 [Saprospiraceae bacterium]
MPVVDILLPKMGESVAEATILKWLKKSGETIQKDETLVEIGTDKVESDLPSEFDGQIVEILAPEGSNIEVGAVIARMEVPESALQHITAPENNSQQTQVATVSNAGSSQETSKNQGKEVYKNAPVFLSPVVQKIAVEKNISLEEISQIRGTGANNRISKKDLLAFVESKQTKAQPTSAFLPQKRNLPITDSDHVEQLSRMRQIIADRMLESVNTIPHVTTFAEVDITGLKQWRTTHKKALLEQHGVNVTYTHIMMHAVVQSLQGFPKLNAWLNGRDEFIQKQAVALGFATALPDGNLIVPNIKNAQSLKLIDLALAVNATAEQARAGKIPADAIQHTTFTVSNTGKFGSLMGTPLISVPQVAVLALGEIHRKPLVYMDGDTEQFGPRDAIMLSISYDHRVIDCAYAASFLKDLKQRLEAYHSA